MSDVTRILSAIEQGDPQAAEQLLPLPYQELRRLAAQKLAREKRGQTLEATAAGHGLFPPEPGAPRDAPERRGRGGPAPGRGAARAARGRPPPGPADRFLLASAYLDLGALLVPDFAAAEEATRAGW